MADGTGERLAVVVVHGMGEQQPARTLVPFSKMILPDDTKYFSRPTMVSDSYEARRHHIPRFQAQTGSSDPPVEMDIFEYHWSYRMKDNRLRDLGAVAFRTMLPTNGAIHLVPVAVALAAIVVIGVVHTPGAWPQAWPRAFPAEGVSI